MIFAWIGLGILLLIIFFYAFNGKEYFKEGKQNVKQILDDTRNAYKKVKNGSGQKTAEENREVENK